MSEKRFENFRQHLSSEDKGFLDELGQKTEILSEEKLVLFEAAKEQFIQLGSSHRAELISGYKQGLEQGKYSGNEKIMVEEFLEWAEKESDKQGSYKINPN